MFEKEFLNLCEKYWPQKEIIYTGKEIYPQTYWEPAEFAEHGQFIDKESWMNYCKNNSIEDIQYMINVFSDDDSNDDVIYCLKLLGYDVSDKD